MNGDDFSKAEIERLAGAVFRTRQNLGDKLAKTQAAMKEVDAAFSTMLNTWDNYSEKKDAYIRQVKKREAEYSD